MKENTSFSIITVCFNAAKTIEKTIDSVLNQNYDDFEYIIIDGGSNDGTLDILKQYEKRIVVRSEPDEGIYDAMNKGLTVANGDFVIFLGADDVFYDHNVLSNVSERLNDTVTVYYGNVVNSDTGQLYDGEFNNWKWGYENICHQSLFYPKSVYKYQKYDLSYKYMADWVYNLKLLSQKVPFHYMGVTISYYNREGASALSKDISFKKDRRSLVVDAVGFAPYIWGLFIRLAKVFK